MTEIDGDTVDGNAVDQEHRARLAELADQMDQAAESAADFGAKFAQAWWEAQPFARPSGLGFAATASLLTQRAFLAGSAGPGELERALFAGVDYGQTARAEFAELADAVRASIAVDDPAVDGI